MAVRGLVFAGPLGLGFLAGTTLASFLAPPEGTLGIVVWWTAVVGVSTVAATLTDRLARRLLPLAVLLRMTMVFPDRAPSRLRVARRVGNVADLKRRVAEAQTAENPDLGEAAELILSLAAALSQHDRRTRGHAERTRAYTELLAEELGLSEDDRDRLRWAALLHDVGKLEVPAEILNKDGPLDPDEWEVVRQHPIHGMKLVEPLIPWLGEWAKTIEHHHERWDGSGYPHGLSGTDISYGARIVAVADAYDVMTSGRAYKAAMSPAGARREIAAMAGTQFDPTVARALMNVSLGKLRWAMGPLAVLAEIPFLGGIERLGRDMVTVMATSAVMTTAVLSGVVTTPISPVQPSEVAEQVTEMVIASAGLRPVGPVTRPRLFDIPDTLPFEDPSVTDPLPVAGTPTPSGGSPGTAAPPTSDSPNLPGSGAEGSPAAGQPGPTTPPTTPPAPPATQPPTTPPGTSPTPPPVTQPPTTPPPIQPPPTPPPTQPPQPPGTPPPTAPVLPSGPTVGADRATVAEDTSTLIPVLANDTDPDGDLDPASLRVVTNPGGGVATAEPGGVEYTPAPDWNGTDTFEYEVCDLGGRCARGTVTVDVTPVNDLPRLGSPRFETPEETLLEAALGFTDPDGDPLRCLVSGLPATGAVTVPADCSQLVYQPAPDFFGTVEVVITVSDAEGSVDVTVTIEVLGVNDPPTAYDDTASTSWDRPVSIPVLANDTDPDGDRLTVTIGSGPSTGSARVDGGSIVYTPTLGSAGTYTVTYQACDPAGACSQATVTVNVSAVTVAFDDVVTTDERHLRVDVTANDVPGSGAFDYSTLRLVSEPDVGRIRIHRNGRIEYKAPKRFTGVVTFVYEICDTAGSCDTATVTITVTRH